MRVLLDPNVFIYREDDEVLSNNLQELIRILTEFAIQIVIHPLTLKDLDLDSDGRRSKIMLSKVKAYPILEAPPDPKEDYEYKAHICAENTSNDVIDTVILYSVYRDAVDFLVTENKGLHKKARRLELDSRVYLIDEALHFFKGYILKEGVVVPPALKSKPVSDLNLNDPIFDTLKEEYPEFEDWFAKISREGRESWVYYREDGSIGALLIYKVETDPIDSIPPLPKKKRLKIATFKVDHVGYKIGELFVKLAIEIAIKNNIYEMYLTHFTQPDDRLVELISEYGFNKVADNSRGEEIFIKNLVKIDDFQVNSGINPREISKQFYPSFYDGDLVKKFVVPIRPEYHQKLFTDFPTRQTTLSEHVADFIVEGNTIRKAYLSHSNIRSMRPGDIVLFYRSGDLRAITSIGVVEAVYTRIDDSDQIAKLVGKRTVFSREEINECVKRPVFIFLFRHHFHLKPITFGDLHDANILSGRPMSILEISNNDYNKIKQMSDLDECFTIN